MPGMAAQSVPLSLLHLPREGPVSLVMRGDWRRVSNCPVHWDHRGARLCRRGHGVGCAVERGHPQTRPCITERPTAPTFLSWQSSQALGARLCLPSVEVPEPPEPPWSS